jgi:hypothetical protein
MNAIKSLVAIVATVAATGAFAAEATPDTWVQEARSVTSRQAVNEQARDARVAGHVGVGEASIAIDATNATPALTRAQVAAEARAALRQGLIKVGEA